MSRAFSISARWMLLLLVCCACAASAAAQRRDYLTEPEVEIVRDAQDIDARIDVLIKMIDRRFNVLGINVNGWKAPAKNSETWGDPPAGTRPELFNDIKKILQKAVDDIDNLAANPNAAPVRDKGDKKTKKDPERFPAAVRSLAAASRRYLDPLKAELDRSASDAEKGSIIDSIELCTEVLEAVGKLPAETGKTKN